jgi:hypothetical protein
LGISFVSFASAAADFATSVSIMRSFANRFTGEVAHTNAIGVVAGFVPVTSIIFAPRLKSGVAGTSPATPLAIKM